MNAEPLSEVGMKNPYPVNLLTPDESRSGGWQAEARDKDGHLISQHAPFESGIDLSEYVREENKLGHTVTYLGETH